MLKLTWVNLGLTEGAHGYHPDLPPWSSPPGVLGPTLPRTLPWLTKADALVLKVTDINTKVTWYGTLAIRADV